jgi:hypothetical protein
MSAHQHNTFTSEAGMRTPVRQIATIRWARTRASDKVLVLQLVRLEDNIQKPSLRDVFLLGLAHCENGASYTLQELKISLDGEVEKGANQLK